MRGRHFPGLTRFWDLDTLHSLWFDRRGDDGICCVHAVQKGCVSVFRLLISQPIPFHVASGLALRQPANVVSQWVTLIADHFLHLKPSSFDEGLCRSIKKRGRGGWFSSKKWPDYYRVHVGYACQGDVRECVFLTVRLCLVCRTRCSFQNVNFLKASQSKWFELIKASPAWGTVNNN